MTQLSTLPACSDINRHQQIELFPTFAYKDLLQGVWHLSVAGYTFQNGVSGIRQRMFLQVLQRLLRTPPASLRENPILASRVNGFLAEPQGFRRIVLRIGEQMEHVRTSGRNGHFRGKCLLREEELARICPTERDPSDFAREGFLDVQVMLPAGDERSFSGRIQIVPHDGVSVISDIDDTLKVSEVADRGRLLKNTFLHPFVPVPGMAELYRQWHAAGATFHYVSSSPWQLYRPLAELLRSEGFPDGSFHLRSSQFRDPSLLRLLVSRKRNKYRIIRAILRVLPQRRFILVGDSGEKDPEIYGLIARKFPAQIERILIRRVSGRSWTKKRCRQVFRDVPCDRWQTFRDPRQIRGVLELVSRTPA